MWHVAVKRLFFLSQFEDASASRISYVVGQIAFSRHNAVYVTRKCSVDAEMWLLRNVLEWDVVWFGLNMQTFRRNLLTPIFTVEVSVSFCGVASHKTVFVLDVTCRYCL